MGPKYTTKKGYKYLSSGESRAVVPLPKAIALFGVSTRRKDSLEKKKASPFPEKLRSTIRALGKTSWNKKEFLRIWHPQDVVFPFLFAPTYSIHSPKPRVFPPNRGDRFRRPGINKQMGKTLLLACPWDIDPSGWGAVARQRLFCLGSD